MTDQKYSDINKPAKHLTAVEARGARISGHMIWVLAISTALAVIVMTAFWFGFIH